jgi:hypothetical protein
MGGIYPAMLGTVQDSARMRVELADAKLVVAVVVGGGRHSAISAGNFL